MSHRFSALLVQHRVVSIRDMDAALRRQRNHGGRLGTNLLEVSSADPALLLHTLAQVVHLPPLTHEQLQGLEPAIAATIPAAESLQLGFLPMRARGGWIEAVVLDPLGTHERTSLEDRMGAPIRTFIGLEIHFRQILNRLHGVPLDPRFAELDARYPLPVATAEADEIAPDHPGGGAPSIDETAASPDAAAGAESAGDLPSEAAEDPPETGPVAPPRPAFTAEGPFDLRLAIEHLEQVRDRRAFVESLLDISLGACCRVAIVAHREGRLRVLALRDRAGSAPELPDEPLPIPTQETALATCFAGQGYSSGPPEQLGIEGFYPHFGLQSPVSCVVLPVPVRGRVALAVVGDCGDERLDPALVPALLLLYRRAGDALARVILAERVAAQDAAADAPTHPASPTATPDSDAPHKRDDDVWDFELGAVAAPPTRPRARLQRPAHVTGPERSITADDAPEPTGHDPSPHTAGAEHCDGDVDPREAGGSDPVPTAEPASAAEPEAAPDAPPPRHTRPLKSRTTALTATIGGRDADRDDERLSAHEQPTPMRGSGRDAVFRVEDAGVPDLPDPPASLAAPPSAERSEIPPPQAPEASPPTVATDEPPPSRVFAAPSEPDASVEPDAPADSVAPSESDGSAAAEGAVGDEDDPRASEVAQDAPLDSGEPARTASDEGGAETAPLGSEAIVPPSGGVVATAEPATNEVQGPLGDGPAADAPLAGGPPADASAAAASSTAEQPLPDTGGFDGPAPAGPGSPDEPAAPVAEAAHAEDAEAEASDGEAPAGEAPAGAAPDAEASGWAAPDVEAPGTEEEAAAPVSDIGPPAETMGRLIARSVVSRGATLVAATTSVASSESDEAALSARGSTDAFAVVSDDDAAEPVESAAGANGEEGAKTSLEAGASEAGSPSETREASGERGNAGDEGEDVVSAPPETLPVGAPAPQQVSAAAAADAPDPSAATASVPLSPALQPGTAAGAAVLLPDPADTAPLGRTAGRSAEVRDLDLDDPAVLFASVDDDGTVLDNELDRCIDALNLGDNTYESRLDALRVAMGPERWAAAVLRHFPGRLRVDRHSPMGARQAVGEHGPLLRFIDERIEAFGGALAEVLGHGTDEARYYAFRLLAGHLGSRARVRYARTLVFDSDPPLRMYALQVLEVLRETEAFEQLLGWLREQARSADPREQDLALNALLHFRDEGALPVLIDLLEHRSMRIRGRAHQVLTVLTCMVFEPDPQLWRRWARQYGASSRGSWILTAMTHSAQRVRENAARALREIPGLQVQYSADGDPAERRLAQRFVQHFLAQRASEEAQRRQV